MNPTPEEAIQLLQKAAQCYMKAGWFADACRVWEQLGDYQQAAQCYEQQENWQKAAQCYEQAQNWAKAAHCYLMCEDGEAAANSWLQAGETLQAAWIWADSLQQVYRTKGELINFIPQTEIQALEIELITARCHASSGKKRESALILREQLNQILKLVTPSNRHLYTWGLRIAEVIRRPDLTALMYATGYRAKLPNVCKEWEIWALATMGDATGIPKEEAVEEEASYEFEVVTVNRKGEIINRVWHKARYFREPLAEGIELEMVYIPGGNFIMGTPDTEKKSDWSQGKEVPQHQVVVQAFYMGKYQVTQAQWQAVAKLPKIERDLNPEPSRFKGENRPVECVSWYDAVEFCGRLSKATGKEYRLPSEGEWEYACRAGTTTPFHYGETITSQLANYAAHRDTYAEETVGKYRQQTTPVGSFPPNAFGLYDMHGNVYEWCADPWHDNYEGAPKDGSVWRDNGNDNRSPLLRGGSWNFNSWYCRSGYRLNYGTRVNFSGYVGFRVVCVVGRT
ncbi:formylglycine-generating enzyme family protein [Calothrix sp. PCC 6303]|uniref:formylglycine-generating enzyme family protein n=1 Tax=Calothrix sp. PCC 6303 TaxID=1170562 RepID=UPI0002A02C0A|nr:formylglycine-generating enzyme family protein [Calothrix sp. PCC 6303]AFZ01320.1 Sulphatase-modifying factor protein [Calothrix sp. PCC 6303]